MARRTSSRAPTTTRPGSSATACALVALEQWATPEAIDEAAWKIDELKDRRAAVADERTRYGLVLAALVHERTPRHPLRHRRPTRRPAL
jgi:hypothetical protein